MNRRLKFNERYSIIYYLILFFLKVLCSSKGRPGKPNLKINLPKVICNSWRLIPFKPPRVSGVVFMFEDGLRIYLKLGALRYVNDFPNTLAYFGIQR